MRREKDRLIFSAIRGRNGADSPIALAEDEAVEALNVEFVTAALCRKRRGSIALSLTSGPSANVEALLSFQATGGSQQLFAYGNASVFYRLVNSLGTYSWSTPSMTDAGTATEANGAALNDKLFLCYDSAANRLHCWDGTSIRRVGLTFPPVVTVANTGAGAYAATIRYYKTAWAHISGSDTIRRSELCPTAVSFTPSGGGTHARVTRGTAPSEGETHWLLYASPDDVYSNYRLIATVAIATTTYDDNGTPSAYSGDSPQIAGLNIPPPSAKYIISDGNRLIMAGAYESSALSGQTVPKNSRVWFTRVLGSSDIGDDETIPNTSAVGTTPAQKNWVDLGESDGDGEITGLGIVGGTIYVFKNKKFWRLMPTGDDLAPYRAVLVSPHVGCVSHKTIQAGELRDGMQVLYFCAESGPCYVSVDGAIQYIGRPIEDCWLPVASKDLAFAVFYPAKRQYWLYMLGGPLLVEVPGQPGTQVAGCTAVYDVAHGGWSLIVLANEQLWNCAAMFANLNGSMGVGDGQKPVFGGDALFYKFDDTSATADAGTAFQAYVDSRPYFPAGLGTRVLLHDSVITAEVASGVTLTELVIRDFEAERRTATVSLTASGTEARVIRRVEESGFASCAAVQIRLGDAAAASNHWAIDALSARLGPQEDIA